MVRATMQDSDASVSESDGSDSLADSAFIYKAQAAKYGGSMGAPEFDRMSQRLERDLGLGNDMESLLSMDRGGSQVMKLLAALRILLTGRGVILYCHLVWSPSIGRLHLAPQLGSLC